MTTIQQKMVNNVIDPSIKNKKYIIKIAYIKLCIRSLPTFYTYKIQLLLYFFISCTEPLGKFRNVTRSTIVKNIRANYAKELECVKFKETE